MKKDIHSKDYRPVVFEDLNTGDKVLTKSTVKADEKVKWTDGNEYPLVKVHISSFSHPFFTGQEKMIDIEGRVDRFKARTEAAAKAKADKIAAATKKTAKKVAKKAEEIDEIAVEEVKKVTSK